MHAQYQSLSLSQPSDSWIRQVGQTLALRWRNLALKA